MRETDWPLVGPFNSMSDQQQGQTNRAERDGQFQLPRIIEEFGNDPFTEEDYLDAFSSFVKVYSRGDRKLNVKAALESLVKNDYIQFEEGFYQVTDLGRAFADHLEECPDLELDEDDYD